MKILLVTMEFPPQKGGVGNYYYNLVKHCSEVNWIIVADNNRESRISNLESQISNSKTIGQNFFYKHFWPRWLKLFFIVRRLIKQEKIDLIWVGQVLPVGTVCYLINKFYNVPYFVSTHGMDIMLPQKSVRKKKLMMSVLKSAKFITANSQFTKNQLLKLGIDENKVEVIYPCSHVSRITNHESNNKVEEMRERLGLKNKKVLLTVGRLVKRKGQDKVIEVMSQLTDKYPNLIYLIVGDGIENSNFEFRISNLGLKNQVQIINNVSDGELPLYYQLADIFIMPARDINGDVEGFGMVYLEAASFGLPVIAGKSGGVGEAVIERQTGILVNPERVEEIKEAIINLFEDVELRKRLGRQGQERNLSEFNWEKQANRLLSRIKKTQLNS